VTNGWGPVEKDRSNGETGEADGGVITLNGRPYAKGLGVHALSQVAYALGGACAAFQAAVGVDDEVGANGSVVFQVWADGVKIFESGPMTGATEARAVTVDVTGRNLLTLTMTDGGDGPAYDHGDWADARVTCNSGGF
jgi:alpha-galactosidase